MTLDDVERTFLAADVLICDGDDTPIGVAGVMGGASTEISDTTTNVLLEAAWWHPMQIARTSTRLNLRSEASRRFERGTDIWGLDLAVERFCSLLAESGAVAAPDVIDERGDVPERPPITVRTDRVNLITGLDLDAPTIQGLLEPIGFTVAPEADGAQVVEVPSFRPDVVEEIDVIEEVARHHGYARLPQTVPLSPHTGALTERQQERRRIRATLVGLGLAEALPMPFLAPDDLARAGLDAQGITVTNPLDARESVAAHLAAPGPAEGRGLQRQPPQRPASACSRSARSSSRRPAADERPAEPEHLGRGARRPGGARRRRRSGGPGRGARPSTGPSCGPRPSTASTRPAARRSWSATPWSARWGRSTPPWPTEFGIDERVACLEVDLDALADAPRRRPDLPAGQPVPLQRHRPGLRRARRRARRRGRGHDPRRRPATCWPRVRLFDVFRGELAGRRTCARLAYALRLQADRPDAEGRRGGRGPPAGDRRRRVHPRGQPPGLSGRGGGAVRGGRARPCGAWSRPSSGEFRHRTHRYGTKIWFGPEAPPKEHYEAQVVGKRDVPEAEVLAVEVGFHSEHPKAPENQAVLDALLAEREGLAQGARRRRPWPASSSAAPTTGAASARPGPTPNLDDPELGTELAMRLLDYIEALEPLRPTP